jgi:hypothetical protein
MTAFQGGAPHVALFFCVLAVFSATVGALSMAVTVGESIFPVSDSKLMPNIPENLACMLKRIGLVGNPLLLLGRE